MCSATQAATATSTSRSSACGAAARNASAASIACARTASSCTKVGGQGDHCVPLAEMAAIYQRARIVVNFAEIVPDVFACRGRVFEATMSGALLVERDNVHTNRWLRPGLHYASYRDLGEMAFVVRYWLQHEDGRKRLAARGRDHVAAHCSAENYWRPLLELAHRPFAVLPSARPLVLA
ncbi:MAG: glycosyltransferase family 1 protein [Planctomycetes bacterium]|nr:glycosyltransferase family 1 protein [Planctomycetota bacterium]